VVFVKVILLAPANNTHTIKWLDYYDKKGITVINVSLESHRDVVERKYWSNIKRLYLKLPFKGKLSYPFTANQLKDIIKTENPDLLHAHYASSYGLIGALVDFHPYVVSVWGSDIYVFPNQNFITKKIMEFTLNRADKICATSVALKEETQKYHSIKDITITPFGVDTEVFKPLNRTKENESITIGLVKGMDWKYGVEYLIRAFKELERLLSGEEFSKLQLMIVGDGPYLPKYKKLVHKLHINDQVTFRGRVKHEEVPSILNGFDIFVVPSVFESFGVAALEAQACGVPVLASDVGGLPEVVIEGKTGFMFPKGDYKAIAAKLALLIKDKELREELGENAVHYIKSTYNWEENADIMMEVYHSITSSKEYSYSTN
jgi:glycosyltransferase involved in cell wall biosynthesis